MAAEALADGYVAHAPGYVNNDGPKIVTSRFGYEDSHTRGRYEATGGYEGLRTALSKVPAEVHSEVRDAVLLGRGGCGFPGWRQVGLPAARQASPLPRSERR